MQGWSKSVGRRMGLVSLSSSADKLLELRLKICGACPHVKRRKFVEILNSGEDVEVEGLYCPLCHCPCLEKGMVTDEKCPIDKW